MPSPGFQVEVVLVDYDPAAAPAKPPSETSENSGANSAPKPTHGPVEEPTAAAAAAKDSKKDKDDEFSDSDSEESTPSKSSQTGASSQSPGSVTAKDAPAQSNADLNEIANLTRKTEQVALGSSAATPAGTGKETGSSVGEVSEFKAMAADASIFTFGDEDDDESD